MMSIRSLLNTVLILKLDLKSRSTDCVTIIDFAFYTQIGQFVIPGLIRNPVLFQSVTLLDAGSSPA